MSFMHSGTVLHKNSNFCFVYVGSVLYSVKSMNTERTTELQAIHHQYIKSPSDDTSLPLTRPITRIRSILLTIYEVV